MSTKDTAYKVTVTCHMSTKDTAYKVTVTCHMSTKDTAYKVTVTCHMSTKDTAYKVTVTCHMSHVNEGHSVQSNCHMSHVNEGHSVQSNCHMSYVNEGHSVQSNCKLLKSNIFNNTISVKGNVAILTLKYNLSNSGAVILYMVCKLLETLIRDHMVEFFVKHELINTSQHRFLKARSCLTNLLCFLGRNYIVGR